jgi:GT2 family glycosyltransferase
VGRRVTVSVVTPWRGHPELCAGFARVVAGADEVVIVDNASEPHDAAEVMLMLRRMGYPARHLMIRLPENAWFTRACNIGLERASGDVILMLNNDVDAEASQQIIECIRRDVRAGGLYGPSVSRRAVDGITIPYVEGWCVAATRCTWEMLGGWDAESYPRPYWEDVDLSFRASIAGARLYRTKWRVRHLGNTTSMHTPGAYDYSAENRATFEARVRDYLRRKNAEAA